MWKSPEALGNEIYEWAIKVDLLGTVFTIYELYAGDEYQDSGELIHHLILINL
jgi:hypothetical protein